MCARIAPAGVRGIPRRDSRCRARPDACREGRAAEEPAQEALEAQSQAYGRCAAHAARGAATAGAWMIVTGTPCKMCAKLIHHAGIVRVVTIAETYSTTEGVEYLEDNGVEVVHLPWPPEEEEPDESWLPPLAKSQGEDRTMLSVPAPDPWRDGD